METIIQALTHTPWWVYLLFVFIFYKGVRSLKTRVVPLKKLIIVPLVVSAISLDTLFTQIQLNGLNIVLLSSSAVVGLLGGYFMTVRTPIEVDKEHLVYKMPGGVSTLLLIIGVFATKYYIGYEEAVDPTLMQQGGFETFVIIASMLLAGLFIGKLLGYAYHYRKTEGHGTPLV
ncbi:MAG: DUF6622 family protein [Hydrogenovibrio sp.]